jgi:serine/threonine-protein kinase
VGYELIHRLAHGGMATVYLGRAKGKAGFEKVVAVKVIHPHLAAEAEFVGMFLDEARIAARIHHPHVVEILDLGESNGSYYMVMEFIEGENLAALIRALDGEPLPIGVVLQILADTLGPRSRTRAARPTATHQLASHISPHNILINLVVGRRSALRIAKAAGNPCDRVARQLAYMSPSSARRRDGRPPHRSVRGWSHRLGTVDRPSIVRVCDRGRDAREGDRLRGAGTGRRAP